MAAPVVFSCRACKAIVGDSFSLLWASAELNAIALARPPPRPPLPFIPTAAALHDLAQGKVQLKGRVTRALAGGSRRATTVAEDDFLVSKKGPDAG